ncbi:MAG: succinylglutamate desuccinylase/aspartoacylase family protein [Verrucomicrobiota bacterium]|nr:succinylglutamate desuccinylase/aspartoacylase family protein [Verrucomicrobiota bacterium]
MIRTIPFLLFLGIGLNSLGAEKFSTGLLAEGTKWETPFYQRDSGIEGPIVFITGGIHGNEPAGARAAEQIRHWPIKKGQLIIVPKVNLPGLRADTRYLPGKSKELRDLNRNFPKTKEGPDAKDLPASTLWEYLKNIKPDWFIDLHEGYDFHQLNSDSVGTSIIDTKGNLANEVVPKMLKAVNAPITDPKKKFVRLRYPVDGSIARAAHERIGANSMILETTKKNQPISTRTRQHRLMVHVLLSHLGMVEKESVHVLVPKKSKELKIAVYDAGGVGGTGPNSLDKVFAETKTHLRRVGAVDIRSSTLNQFDLVIFPGGSGSKQAAALGSDGRKLFKKFIDGGGGYVGICAGAYLAASNYEWSLGISNHKTFCKTINLPEIGPKSMWYRGPSAPVKMELTEEGKAILGNIKGSFEVRYHNGPIMSFIEKDGLDPFQSLATFRSEVSKYKPQQGTMVNSPAIIAGEFGEGRVLCISPHPESDSKLYKLLQNAARWVAD